MRTMPSPQVRLSERRASIGFVILMIVSLGLLGAQALVTPAQAEPAASFGGGAGGGS